MATSVARHITGDAISAPPLRLAFYEEAQLGPARAYNTPFLYDDAQNTQADDTDHLVINGPTSFDSDLAGLIRRIDNLINDRRAPDAISLALDVLGKYGETLSDRGLDRVASKINDALPYLEIDSTQAEARAIRLRLLSTEGLSANWDDKMLNNDTAGFAFAVSALRSTDDLSFDHSGVHPSAPNFALNAA